MTWSISTYNNEHALKKLSHPCFFSDIGKINNVKIQTVSCMYEGLTYEISKTLFLPPENITQRFCEIIKTSFIDNNSFVTGVYFDYEKIDTLVKRKIGFREVNQFLLQHGIDYYPKVWANGFTMYNYTTFLFESMDLLEDIINADLYLKDFFILLSRNQVNCSFWENMTSHLSYPKNLLDLREKVIKYSLNCGIDMILFDFDHELLRFHAIQITS